MAARQRPGHGRDSRASKQGHRQKRKRIDVEVESLQSRLDALDPKLPVNAFSDLPLSEPTAAGLKSAHFSTLTDIQQRAIPHALKGHDILGAAKTGSGKTLAFLVPVLENLYRANHVGADAGLGAMIISPTRELAIQIFDVLHKVGRKGHLFAAGLVIGGKSLQEERDALVRMNILVCTPGRILQHLSQTAGFAFNVDALRMLVLDEADRILDMGFQRDVDAIIEYLPTDRQTLLFSATQTKRVSDLARLSLKDPEYISVHEAATTATPQTLQQNYVLSPLPEKLDTLYSFIQSSKKSKILVFLSSGKQVRFVYEAFRHLQPGVPLLHLHGRQKQTARLDITQRFATAKTACLFATDVVARGLDFPAVDWVVQVDCPEDADTYIHRVGRTARYEREGRAVLFLDPSEEEGMLSRLAAKKVPIEKINVKQKKKQSIRNQLQNMCFKDPQLKYLGQKAFISYVKSVQLQKDKDVFKLRELALEDFASSLGLPGAPRIKYIGTAQNEEEQRRLKNAPRRGMSPSDDSDDGEDQSDGDRPQTATQSNVRTKYDRMFQRTNQDVLSSHYSKLVKDADVRDEVGQLNGEALDDSGDEDAGFLAVKRRIRVPADDSQPNDQAGHRVVHIEGALEPVIVDSKRREKLLTSKKKLAKLKGKGTKTVFDEEGNPHAIYEFDDEDKFKAQGRPEEQREQFAEKERARILDVDAVDKAEAKRKKKEKIRKRRERERAEAADGNPRPDHPEANNVFDDFVNDAAGLDDDDDEVPQLTSVKKAPKWFQQNDVDDSDMQSDDGHRRRRGKKQKAELAAAQPETLEDLERIAEGLLG